jgi:hypothetical protein
MAERIMLLRIMLNYYHIMPYKEQIINIYAMMLSKSSGCWITSEKP